GADDAAGILAQRGQTFARRQAGGDDVLDHQHARALGDRKTAPELERPALALDENRFRAEPARRLVARHDAAERRRGDDVDLAEFLPRLGRQGATEFFRAGRVLEDEHLLQEDGGMPAGTQDEMAFEQRAGGAELVEGLFGGQGHGPVLMPLRFLRNPSPARGGGRSSEAGAQITLPFIWSAMNSA